MSSSHVGQDRVVPPQMPTGPQDYQAFTAMPCHALRILPGDVRRMWHRVWLGDTADFLECFG